MSAPLGGTADIVAPVVMAPVWESLVNITLLQIGLVVALGTRSSWIFWLHWTFIQTFSTDLPNILSSASGPGWPD